jgi:hypothetical protein
MQFLRLNFFRASGEAILGTLNIFACGANISNNISNKNQQQKSATQSATNISNTISNKHQQQTSATNISNKHQQ